MPQTTRAVVIERVALVRAGISSVLREHHIAVVAEAGCAADARSLVRGSEAHLLVVGDGGDGSGLPAAIRRVKERSGVLVVALVPRCSREELLAILDAGADAVVSDDVEREQLVAALDAVRAGERHLAGSVAAVLFASLEPAAAVAPLPDPGVLTVREHAVVRLLADNRTNDEIALELFISAATVKTHLSNAYGKLGARNRYEAVVKATRLGLL